MILYSLKSFLKITSFADRGLQNIFLFDNTKIHYSAKLIEMCLNISILLRYLLLYFYNYNQIKILFTILKYYIKKNRVLINRYIEKKRF